LRGHSVVSNEKKRKKKKRLFNWTSDQALEKRAYKSLFEDKKDVVRLKARNLRFLRGGSWKQGNSDYNGRTEGKGN